MTLSDNENHFTSDEKLARLKELAYDRRKAPETARYKNFSSYDRRHDDHCHVSPLTKGARNVNSKIVVMMQDWTSTEDMKKISSDSYFSSPTHILGHDPNSRAMQNLQTRLSVHFKGIRLENTYATNLFPFIKVGRTDAAISSADLKFAATVYAVPQIEIVQPTLVIALGINTFWALAKSLDHKKPADRLKDSIGEPIKTCQYQIWCQAHTAVDVRSLRTIEKVNAAWAAMADWYNHHERK